MREKRKALESKSKYTTVTYDIAYVRVRNRVNNRIREIKNASWQKFIADMEHYIQNSQKRICYKKEQRRKNTKKLKTWNKMSQTQRTIAEYTLW